MQHLVIIGGGQATASLLGSLQRWQQNQPVAQWRVTVVSAETAMAVNRPLLSKDFLLANADSEPQSPTLLTPGQLASMQTTLGLQWLAASRVVSMDRQRRCLQLQDGRQLDWDYLVLATGGQARTLPVSVMASAPDSGSALLTLRSFDDAVRLRSRLQNARRLLVVGGGYIGLEVAASARQLGLEVTLLERGERILQRVAPEPVAHWFEQQHRDQGVSIRHNTSVESWLLDNAGQLRGARLTGGEELAADLVVVGIGLEPAVELAMAAGLDCQNGIGVDEQCQTSDPRIFAAGDNARRLHPYYRQWLRLESVENAVLHGQIIAAALTGQVLPPTGVPWFWSNQYQQRLQIVGLVSADAITIARQRSDGSGSSWVCLDPSGQIQACYAVNWPAEFMQAKKLIGSRSVLDTDLLADSNRSLGQCLAELANASADVIVAR